MAPPDKVRVAAAQPIPPHADAQVKAKSKVSPGVGAGSGGTMPAVPKRPPAAGAAGKRDDGGPLPILGTPRPIEVMPSMCGAPHCYTDEELNQLGEDLKTPELRALEAKEAADEAKRKAADAEGDATRHERLLQFGSVMAQKHYLPEDVRDMMDKHLSMRDMLVLKRFGFVYPTNLITRSKIRTRVIDAINEYDKDWQARHQGTQEQAVENRKADEFQAIVDADTARKQAAYNPAVLEAIEGGPGGAIGYGIGGDRGALIGSSIDGFVMAAGALPGSHTEPASTHVEDLVEVRPGVTQEPVRDAPTASTRQEQGEIVWTAMEQYAEKFAMDAGISPGDRIRLEGKAMTQTAKLKEGMQAAGYQWVERTTPEEGWSGRWEPIPGKANADAAARAQRNYAKSIAAIAQERNVLRDAARSSFFARESGPTTLDPDNLDFGPASREVCEMGEPLQPDITLPLAEPKHITRPGQVPAEVGLVGRHRHQPPRGSEMISEHVGPGAQYRIISETPDGPIYDENQYEGDKTRLERKEVSDFKTHKGDLSANKRTEALKAKAARGERIDPMQDIVVPSVRQHIRAVDAVRAKPTGGDK